MQTPPGLNEIVEAGQIPDSLENTVAKCLEKEPASRFQSMEDLVKALEETQEEIRLEELEKARENEEEEEPDFLHIKIRNIASTKVKPIILIIASTAIGACIFIVVYQVFFSKNLEVSQQTQKNVMGETAQELATENKQKTSATSSTSVVVENEADRVLRRQLEENPNRENLIVDFGVTNNGIKHLEKSRHIKNLVLQNCLNLETKSINNALKNLPLERLDLRRTNADDSTLEIVGTKYKLNYLDLTETLVTSEGLAHLANLQNLTYLNMRKINIDDKNMESIGKLKKLKHLLMHSTLVSDPGIAKLTSLQNLLIINIENTKVTKDCIKSLGKLKSLVNLELSNNNLEGASLEPLTHLKYLQKLNVTDSSLSKESISNFQKKKKGKVNLILDDR